jgi:hypothetical protein
MDGNVTRKSTRMAMEPIGKKKKLTHSPPPDLCPVSFTCFLCVQRCEKCAQDLDNFKWRLMLSLSLADYSDTVWATCFQVQSLKIS